MVTMICLRPFRYAGKLLKPGEHFEAAEEKHAKLLSLIHNARIAGEEEPKKDPEPIIPKRRYKRRDMQAEDG